MEFIFFTIMPGIKIADKLYYINQIECINVKLTLIQNLCCNTIT